MTDPQEEPCAECGHASISHECDWDAEVEGGHVGGNCLETEPTFCHCMRFAYE